MNESKIQLSPEEMQLVQNREWILTKHRVIEKVYSVLGDLSHQMQAGSLLQQSVLPPEVLRISPKISKGEQYERLPYVVLDYPRYFSREHVFAIRTFFWWGNYFSSTLHLKGKFKQSWHEKIVKAIVEGKLTGYYLSTSGNEFDFDLSGRNYSRITPVTKLPDPVMADHAFVKLTNKISFEHWDTAEQRLLGVFQNFIEIGSV